MNKFYSNLVNASEAMQNSADDANRRKNKLECWLRIWVH
jgi:hypothetical protein